MVIGSAATLLHECGPLRVTFKDVDFLVPQASAKKMRDILVEKGFTQGTNGNYKKGEVTIGFATPKTHPGLPSPTDDSAGTKIGAVRVLKLDGLIEAKRLAVESQMMRIVNKGYRRYRQKSAAKHLGDFCALCNCRDKTQKEDAADGTT